MLMRGSHPTLQPTARARPSSRQARRMAWSTPAPMPVCSTASSPCSPWCHVACHPHPTPLRATWQVCSTASLPVTTPRASQSSTCARSTSRTARMSSPYRCVGAPYIHASPASPRISTYLHVSPHISVHLLIGHLFSRLLSRSLAFRVPSSRAGRLWPRVQGRKRALPRRGRQGGRGL